MTIAELERAIESKQKLRKLEAQEKATYDYILGDLIGRSIARLYSSTANYPYIYDVYPTLFDSMEVEEQKRENQHKLSALRFKQFTESYNKRYKK